MVFYIVAKWGSTHYDRESPSLAGAYWSKILPGYRRKGETTHRNGLAFELGIGDLENTYISRTKINTDTAPLLPRP